MVPIGAGFMKKKLTYYIFLFVLVLSGTTLYSQNGVEATVLERYRLYRTWDSLQKIEENTPGRAEKLKTIRQQIDELDRFLPGSYAADVDTAQGSRLKVLIRENNQLREQNEALQQFMPLLIIGFAITLLLFVLFLVLFIKKHTRHKGAQSEIEKLNKVIANNQQRYQEAEDNEDNVVDELRNEINNYKTELSKASDYIVNLRNEKIRIESDLEEYKAELSNIKEKKQALDKKLSQSEDKINQKFDKLSREKKEAEENYNQLYADYQKIEKEHREFKEKAKSFELNIQKEQQERETVRQELMGWIESKNEEIQSIRKSKVRSERNLKEIRDVVSEILRSEQSNGNPFSQRVNRETNDAGSITGNLKKLLKNKNDAVAMLRKERDDKQHEADQLHEKVKELEKSVKEMKDEMNDKDEMLTTELKKRRKLEEQLQSMLKNLKNL